MRGADGDVCAKMCRKPSLPAFVMLFIFGLFGIKERGSSASCNDVTFYYLWPVSGYLPDVTCHRLIDDRKAASPPRVRFKLSFFEFMAKVGLHLTRFF